MNKIHLGSDFDDFLEENRVLAPYNLDESLNDLADTVRSCFDMDEIYQMMEPSSAS